MSMLKATGRALIITLLSASPALAQYGGPGISVRIAPPAPMVERVPMAPSPRHLWTQGHWQWNGMQRRHVWSPGYYQVPPQAGQVWQPAHWVNRGGEWVYAPGHWRGMRPVYQQQPVYEPAAAGV